MSAGRQIRRFQQHSTTHCRAYFALEPPPGTAYCRCEPRFWCAMYTRSAGTGAVTSSPDAVSSGSDAAPNSSSSPATDHSSSPSTSGQGHNSPSMDRPSPLPLPRARPQPEGQAVCSTHSGAAMPAIQQLLLAARPASSAADAGPQPVQQSLPLLSAGSTDTSCSPGWSSSGARTPARLPCSPTVLRAIARPKRPRPHTRAAARSPCGSFCRRTPHSSSCRRGRLARARARPGRHG